MVASSNFHNLPGFPPPQHSDPFYPPPPINVYVTPSNENRGVACKIDLALLIISFSILAFSFAHFQNFGNERAPVSTSPPNQNINVSPNIAVSCPAQNCSVCDTPVQNCPTYNTPTQNYSNCVSSSTPPTFVFNVSLFFNFNFSEARFNHTQTRLNNKCENWEKCKTFEYRYGTEEDFNRIGFSVSAWTKNRKTSHSEIWREEIRKDFSIKPEWHEENENQHISDKPTFRHFFNGSDDNPSLTMMHFPSAKHIYAASKNQALGDDYGYFSEIYSGSWIIILDESISKDKDVQIYLTSRSRKNGRKFELLT